MFKDVKPMTLFGSLRSLTFRLWDEKGRKLIGFRRIKKQRKLKKEETGDGAGEDSNDRDNHDDRQRQARNS